MRLEVNKSDIRIYPEGESDRAYIQHVLGLYENGAELSACRCDVSIGLGSASELHCIRLSAKNDNRQ